MVVTGRFSEPCMLKGTTFSVNSNSNEITGTRMFGSSRIWNIEQSIYYWIFSTVEQEFSPDSPSVKATGDFDVRMEVTSSYNPILPRTMMLDICT